MKHLKKSRSRRSSRSVPLRALAAVMSIITCFGLFSSVTAQVSSPDSIVAGQKAVQLKNGLRIILNSEPALPLVSCQLWYHVGSRNDPPSFRGTCHIVEHLTEQRLLTDQSDLARKLIGKAGKFDAYTSDDFTVFITNVKHEDLEDALALQALCSQPSLCTPGNLKHAKKVVAEEIEKDSRSYAATLSKEVRSVAYRRHPYGFPPGGSIEDVRRLTPAVVDDFKKRWFHPGNATLVLSGRFDAGKALQLASRYFGDVPPGRDTSSGNDVREPAQNAERRVYIKYPGPEDRLLVAFHTPAVASDDAAPLVVLEALLSNPLDGILKHRFVNSKICKSASASYELRKQPGLFTIELVGRQGTSSSTLLAELDKLCQTLRDVTAEQESLNRAKSRARFAFYEKRTGPFDAGFQLGFFDALGNLAGSRGWSKKLMAVKDTDLKRVAARYLTTANRTVGFLITKKDSSGGGGGVRAMIDSSCSGSNGIASLQSGTERPPQYGSIRLAGFSGIGGTRSSLDSYNNAIECSDKQEPQQGETIVAQATLPGQRGSAVESTPSSTVAIKTFERTLANKLKVIVLPVTSSPIVRICGAIPAGRAYDPADKVGLSELNIALMNGDSTKISRIKSRRHQSNRGLATRDLIHFYPGLLRSTFKTSCLKANLGVQLKLISHHMTNPVISESSMEKARQQVRNQAVQVQNNPNLRAQSYLLRNLLDSQSPFSPPVVHDKLRALTTISLEDVEAFRSRHVVPDQATIVFVGDVTIDQACRMTESAFAGWTGGVEEFAGQSAPNKRHVLKVVIPVKDSQRVNLILGRLLQSSSRSQLGRLMLVDCALFRHPLYARLSDVLNYRLKEYDRVQLNSHVTPLTTSTAWHLALEMPRYRSVDIFNKVKQAVDNLAAEGVSESELAALKRYLGGYLHVTRLANIYKGSDTILESLLLGSDPALINTLESDIQEIALEDLNRFISEELSPRSLCMVIAAGKRSLKDARRFKLR